MRCSIARKVHAAESLMHDEARHRRNDSLAESLRVNDVSDQLVSIRSRGAITVLLEV
jgi:hypothetical protein